MRYLIILMILLIGCKTKHKVIQRSKEIVKEVVKKDVKKDSSAVFVIEEIKVKKDESIELTQADPDKTITITDEKGKTLIIKGANAIIKKSVKKEKKKDSIAVKVVTKDNTVIKTDTKTISRDTDTVTTGISTWIWIIIITALVIGAYLWIKRRAKFI